jgi:hypothetical protein
MYLESYIEEQKIEELSTAESTQATLEYLGIDLEYDMSITEVSDWLHKKENPELDNPKDMVWYEDGDTGIGIGFVNLSPNTELLPVGIYFKHPRWRNGKLCRASNQMDLKFFLHISSKIKKYEERE